MMTTRSSILHNAVLGFAVLGAVSVSADVVGWWRFNGDGANVPNVANHGTLDGTIVSISNDTSNAVADPANVSFGSVASKMPTVTERLQGLAPRVYDPLDGSVTGGGKTLSWTKSFVQGGMMVPYSAALALNTFTVQAMIRLPSDAGSRGGYGGSMFPIAQFGKDQTEGWIFGVYEGYLFSRFTYTTTNNVSGQAAIKDYYTTGSGFPSLYDGKWHHVAMVFTTAGANAVCRMFVDGVQYAENRATNWKSWNYSGTLPLFVGANPYNYARTFYGDIAEVRITNDATSKDQSNNFLVPLLDGQGLADDDTALLLTFDNTAAFGFPTNATIVTKETSGTSDTHSNKAYVWYAKNWNILNAAYEKPTIPHWLALATKGEADHLDPALWPTNSAEIAGGLIECASAGSTNAIMDGGSISLPTKNNTGSNTGTSNLIQLDDGACYFSTNSFTAECFFKTSIESSDTDTIFYAPFMKLCINKGKLLLRGYKGGTESSIGDITGTTVVTDDEWHHVACVWDAPTTTFTLWVDGASEGSKSGTALYSGGYLTSSSLSALGFLIGGQRISLSGSPQAFKGALDMVRVTRRALSNDEFLTSAALPERLLDARFDDDTPPTFATGLPDFLAPAGTGATMTGGAAAPALADSRAGSWIFDGLNGTDREDCGKALSLDGGYILYPRNRLLECKAFTVEFFAKFSDLKKDANFLRFSSGDTLSGAPIWGLYNNVDSSNISRIYFAATVSADGGLTTSRKDVPLYNLTENADEKWHHWALTVEPNGTRTRYAFYKDGVCVKEPTNVNADGALYFPPEGTCLAIGGTSASGAYLKGLFDNVRITPGVLSPSQFMQYEPAPFVLSIQ